MSELVRFCRLTYPDGTRVVVRASDVDDLIDDNGTCGPFKLEDVYLTETEFEALQDL